MDLKELFENAMKDCSLESRVQFLWELPSPLSIAMDRHALLVVEFINTTSLAPMVMSYPCRTFNHELENFIYCFEKSGVHKYKPIARNLWYKIIDDTPEPILYQLKFMERLIEEHENWEKFARFIFEDLFGGPRKDLIDPRTVLSKLSSVNGRWPSEVIESIEKLEEKSYLLYAPLDTAYMTVDGQWKEQAISDCLEIGNKRIQNRLTIEESHKVIKTINELFFYS